MIAACGSGTIYPGRGKGETQGSYKITINQMPSHEHYSYGKNMSNDISGTKPMEGEYFENIGSTWATGSMHINWTAGALSGLHKMNRVVFPAGGGQNFIPYSYSFHC